MAMEGTLRILERRPRSPELLFGLACMIVVCATTAVGARTTALEGSSIGAAVAFSALAQCLVVFAGASVRPFSSVAHPVSLVSALSAGSYLVMTLVFIMRSDQAAAYQATSGGDLMPLYFLSDVPAEAIAGFDAALEVPFGKFFADGGIDQWAYFLYHSSWDPAYDQLAVQEHGYLALALALTSIIGSFNTFNLLMLNWLALAGCGILVSRIASFALEERYSLIVGCIFWLVPEFSYWAGVLHKDPIVTFFVASCSFSLCKICLERKPVFSIVFLVALFAIAFLRSGLVLPMLLLSVLSLLLLDQRRIDHLLRFLAVQASGAAVFFLAAPRAVSFDIYRKTFARVVDKVEVGRGAHLDVENIQLPPAGEKSMADNLFGDGGGVVAPMVSQLSGQSESAAPFIDPSLIGAIDRIIMIPIHTVAYLYSPTPIWAARGVFDFFVVPGTLLFALATAPALFAFVTGLVRRGLLVAGILPFVIFSVAVSFAGPFVVDRYRMLLIPYLLVLAAVPFQERGTRLSQGLATASVFLFSAANMLWLALQ
jgi:hypothetical protein